MSNRYNLIVITDELNYITDFPVCQYLIFIFLFFYFFIFSFEPPKQQEIRSLLRFSCRLRNRAYSKITKLSKQILSASFLPLT